MKKAVISVLVFSLCLFMCACEKNVLPGEFSPEQSFFVHMKAQKGETVFEADINCLSYQDITITFTYPEELSGFSVKATSQGYSVNAFGIPDEFSKDEIKDSSLLNVLVGTIKTAVYSNHGKFTENGEFYSAQFVIDGINVFSEFSKDGIISKIVCETAGFSANFSDNS